VGSDKSPYLSPYGNLHVVTSAKTPSELRKALATRVVIADGAMGTMLQAADPSLEDFQGHEGCNEVLNVSRPDVVRSVHDQYLAVGVDAIETNTFGANWANLAEYGIEDRIYELGICRRCDCAPGSRCILNT
jgi:5-methyltetrahydrofolate--homocysteine methyltransferase